MIRLFVLLTACTGDKDDPAAETPPPFGMILADDGQLYAGAARIDITPTGFETFTDLDGDYSFDGCLTDPAASRSGCDEPYDDLNGNNNFDAVWMAGFGSFRAARSAHDPITVSAVVLSLDGEYVAFVGVDALGVLENRIRDARDLLEEDGFDRNRVVISSSHTHQGPDSVGIYGDVESLVSGIYPPFIESIPPAIYDAIATASSVMEPVSPRVGAKAMKDDPTLDGAPFGGTNPDPTVVGGINDIRDPIIEADQVIAVALDGSAGRVATIVSNSGHPEVVGDMNDQLSADYVGYMRDYIESESGGTTVFLSGALGGMQSALGAPLPSVDESGARVLDDQGEPVWITDAGAEAQWEFARTYGTLIAQAAEEAVADDTAWDRIRVRHADFLMPVDNLDFKLAFQVDLLDTPEEYLVQDTSCPGYDGGITVFGCVPAQAYVIELGPLTFGSAPGELMPELFWGVPDEPAMADATLREGDRRWVQSDADCEAVSWDTCFDEERVEVTRDCDPALGGDCDGWCDCLHHHVAPYVHSSDGMPTIESMLPGTYKAPIGIANAYCGYIVPDADFSTYASQLTEDGDHYEETNSCGRQVGPFLLDAFASLEE